MRAIRTQLSGMPAQPTPIIDPIADALINRRVAEQHPHLKPLMDRLTTKCVYDGTPAVRVDTGQLGNRYGLCASCATAEDNSAAAEAATARAAEQFRANNPDVAREHPAHDDTDLTAVIAALPDAIDQAMRETLPDEYTPELASAIAADMTARLTNTPDHAEPALCYLYPGLCDRIDGEDGDAVDANGRHFDHGGNTLTVPSGEMPYDDPEIWAEFVHISGGTPHIGFMGEHLAPDEARLKARQLREFADAMDALADQVDAAIADAPAGGSR
ncbi:hypothetical protein J7E95_24770 [Streptomyces sp. ISL-14]|nr:hypothetical protein [Streptomyces sp. ISL-14]